MTVITCLGLTGCKTRKHTQEIATAKKRPAPVKASSSKLPPEVLQKLGVSDSHIKKSAFYNFVNDWYGVPYRYGGCMQSGVDCSCFANLLYEKVYGRRIARSAADIFQSCKQISVKDATEGDLLFFRIDGKAISHVGVYLGRSYFVHSSTSRGVVISSLEEAYYKKYFYCAGKLPGS